MVREGRKHSESVRRGLSIGHECRNMRPEPGVAHQRTQENGTSHRWRRRQRRCHPHSCCCNATAPVTVAAPKCVPTPTKHPGGHPTHAPNWIPQPGEYPPYPNGPSGSVDTSAPPCSVVTNPTNTHIARNPDVASRDVENQSNDQFDIPVRVPKEGGRWGKRGGGVGERKEGL
jgi:hypothetical protein